MANAFYETTMLREEFKLVAKLQKDPEFSKYGKIFYEDRILDNKKPVSEAPTGARYPEIYFVEYDMPVYVAAGQLRQDWHGSLKITLSEQVLINKTDKNPPGVKFSCNFDPFNNHAKDGYICQGNAWSVAKDNGLWHFIVSLGALINQDSFVSADKAHMNEYAYYDWLRRGRKPVTAIKWPIDLLIRQEISIVPKSKTVKQTDPISHGIKITPKTGQSSPVVKPIVLTAKTKGDTSGIKITLKKNKQ
jgi:hypothetical protein